MSHQPPQMRSVLDYVFHAELAKPSVDFGRFHSLTYPRQLDRVAGLGPGFRVPLQAALDQGHQFVVRSFEHAPQAPAARVPPPSP